MILSDCFSLKLQRLIHLVTSILYEWVPPVSESPGLHQPQGPLGIVYTTMMEQTSAVRMLVRVQQTSR